MKEQSRTIARPLPSQFNDFISGGIAASIARTVTSPLDVVKILFQVQASPIRRGTSGPYTGFVAAFPKIYKEEGIRAFWKGNFISIIRLFTYSGIKFQAFESIKDFIRSGNGGMSNHKIFFAGGAAGVCSVLITHPLDLIRTRFTVQRLQLDPGVVRSSSHNWVVYRSISHCAVTIVRQEGLRGLYRGLLPACIGVIPYEGCTFALYFLVKRWLAWDNHLVRNHLVAGCVAGAIAQTVSYPFDLVKKRLQTQSPSNVYPGVASRHYLGPIDCCRRIFRAEGILGFYKGTIPNILRVAPFVAVQLQYTSN